MSGADNHPPTVPRAVGRTLDLLEIVIGAGECNLTAAAARAGLTPTTTLRYLKALEARGYLARDDNGAFSAGPKLSWLAAAAYDDGPVARLAKAAQPHLDALALRTGESSYLAIGGETHATYIATAESDRAIRHVGWVGRRVPLVGTAVGEALADPGLAPVRTGAVEPDITAVARAVMRGNEVVAALSVIGPKHRMGRHEIKEVTAALVVAAQLLSADLGVPREMVAT